jgi:hypothetical protein
MTSGGDRQQWLITNNDRRRGRVGVRVWVGGEVLVFSPLANNRVYKIAWFHF